MKIVHLCLGSFYPDNYSYQENMLPKFHKKLGYDVEVIASTQSFDSNGNVCFLETTGEYYNEYGIKVTRIPYKNKSKIWKKLKRYKGTYEALENAAPNILFIHGGQFLDIDRVVMYLKKHPGVTVYVDNHADFSNSATNWLSKNILHKILWRYTEHEIEPFTKKFYGVLPARVDFLINIYHLPPEKCELLVMGADDELVEKAKKGGARHRIRAQHNIDEHDFLIVTGGKIDRWKTQTLLLMQAVQSIDNDRLRLIVFGSITEELTESVSDLADGTKVQYVGWIDSSATYDYFEAADLIVFPGRHSVLWEQAVGQGKPLIVKNWSGTNHVDLGGNVQFLTKDDADEIQRKIEHLLDDRTAYLSMLALAQRDGMRVFSYREISKRALGYQTVTIEGIEP